MEYNFAFAVDNLFMRTKPTLNNPKRWYLRIIDGQGVYGPEDCYDKDEYGNTFVDYHYLYNINKRNKVYYGETCGEALFNYYQDDKKNVLVELYARIDNRFIALEEFAKSSTLLDSILGKYPLFQYTKGIYDEKFELKELGLIYNSL